MKIGYLLSPDYHFSTSAHGVKMQATLWAKQLEEFGHDIIYLNEWEATNPNEIDIVHLFGSGLHLFNIIAKLKRYKSKIVFSPIIDSTRSKSQYRISGYAGIKKLRMYSQNYMTKEIRNDIDLAFVRSDYERGFLTQSYGYKPEKVVKVALGSRFRPNLGHEKESFCLNVSTISQPRKNIIRLIRAAQEFNFQLVLAGNPGTAKEFEPLRKAIGNSKNITVKGFVSNEELTDLYKRSKVFALPSITEGVGYVALEAAAFGCDIVMTNIGGPKEYYGELAYLVNPFDVDDIGRNVIAALNETKQPSLAQHIENNFSMEKTVRKLEEAYQSLL